MLELCPGVTAVPIATPLVSTPMSPTTDPGSTSALPTTAKTHLLDVEKMELKNGKAMFTIFRGCKKSKKEKNLKEKQ